MSDCSASCQSHNQSVTFDSTWTNANCSYFYLAESSPTRSTFKTFRLPLVVHKGPPPPRPSWPRSSSVTEISACASLATSSTPSLPPPSLSDPKLFDLLFFVPGQGREPPFQPPPIPNNRQLPHRRNLVVLPLVEGESRRPRQPIEGSVCYRFRPP